MHSLFNYMSGWQLTLIREYSAKILLGNCHINTSIMKILPFSIRQFKIYSYHTAFNWWNEKTSHAHRKSLRPIKLHLKLAQQAQLNGLSYQCIRKQLIAYCGNWAPIFLPSNHWKFWAYYLQTSEVIIKCVQSSCRNFKHFSTFKLGSYES